MDIGIEAWLNGKRSYAEGVALYNEFGSNSALKILFRLKETSVSKQKLHAALIDLSKQQNLKSSALELKSALRIVETKKDTVKDDWEELPSTVQDIILKARVLFQECAEIHSRLNTLVDVAVGQFPDWQETQAEDFQKFLKANHSESLVHTLLEKEDEYTKLFSDANYFREHKKLPEVVVIPDDIKNKTSIQLKEELLLLRSRISKKKKNPKHAIALVEMESRKKLIEERLNELV